MLNTMSILIHHILECLMLSLILSYSSVHVVLLSCIPPCQPRPVSDRVSGVNRYAEAYPRTRNRALPNPGVFLLHATGVAGEGNRNVHDFRQAVPRPTFATVGQPRVRTWYCVDMLGRTHTHTHRARQRLVTEGLDLQQAEH